jgi:glycosyltransferase EpsD
MKKILFCATVDSHFKAFHLPYMKWFRDKGWIVDVAANGTLKLPNVNNKYNIPIQRSPFHVDNVRAYKELSNIINNNNYSIIHSHTPMGGVLTRIAARKSRKSGTKVFYTAHGFHFCKGAPLTNWLSFYPVERMLAHFTDHLITINEEDFQLAVNHKFQARKISHVNGVGVDCERYKPISNELKKRKRRLLGFHQNDFLMIYTAEFSKNKNHQLLIKLMKLVKKKSPNVKLLLAGEGILLEDIKALTKRLGVENEIVFLGYRKDIDEILPLCDVAVSTSYREGLPVNIMEAMASGLPIIATHNRGHVELVKNGTNGWLIENQNIDSMNKKINQLITEPDLIDCFGLKSREIIVKEFSLDHTIIQSNQVYKPYIVEQEVVSWNHQ